MKERIRKELEAEIAQKTWRGRFAQKRAAAKEKGKKWLKKLFFFALGIFALIGLWYAFAPDWAKPGSDVTTVDATPAKPKGIAPGQDGTNSGYRVTAPVPTIKDDGATKTLTYGDSRQDDITFDVIVDRDLNIIGAKLGDKTRKLGGKLSIGTVNMSTESTLRCSHTMQTCDFSGKEKVNLCTSWLQLDRIIPKMGEEGGVDGVTGSDQEKPYWTAAEAYTAVPTNVYPGDSADMPYLCGIEAR